VEASGVLKRLRSLLHRKELDMIAFGLPIYVAPGLILFFCALSQFMLLVPVNTSIAYLLRWSAEIMTARRPRRFVLTLMIFSTVCCAFFIGISLIPGVQSANPLPGAVSLVALQVLWAGKYGSALAVGDGTADELNRAAA
jgi:hypothetical protein